MVGNINSNGPMALERKLDDLLTADFPRLRLLGRLVLPLLPLPPGGPLEVAEEGAAHAHVEEEAGEDDGRAAPTAILLHKELGG